MMVENMSETHSVSTEPTCNSCGVRPAWRWSSAGYCRHCNENNGYHGESRVEIDPDKLEAMIGTYMADRVLRECVAD